MTEQQRFALLTFETMMERAKQHRSGAEVCDSLFYKGYGICDNIDRCVAPGAGITQMTRVKDNIIRQLPSYSGNYHYPVRNPAPRVGRCEVEEAENAWDLSNDRWKGEYGDLRIQQLAELIEFIKNKWSDELTQERTPAQRIGIIPDVTIVERIADGVHFLLSKDDGSSDPYFVPANGGDRISIDLRRLRVLPTGDIEKMSVARFIRTIERKVQKREALEAKLMALQAEIAAMKREEFVLDFHLGKQHGVKRIVRRAA